MVAHRIWPPSGPASVVCQKMTLPMLSSSARSERLRLCSTWSAVCGYLATIMNAVGELGGGAVEADQVRLGHRGPDMIRFSSSICDVWIFGRPATCAGISIVVFAETRIGPPWCWFSRKSPDRDGDGAGTRGHHPPGDAALRLGREPAGAQASRQRDRVVAAAR